MGIFYVACFLVVGYIYSQKSLKIDYELNRSEGWITYIMIAKTGAIICTITASIFLLADAIIPPLSGIEYLNGLVLDIPQLKIFIWFVFSLIFSWGLGIKSQLSTRDETRKIALISKLVVRDKLEETLFKNHKESKKILEDNDEIKEKTKDKLLPIKFISITLKSRKVYVGICNGMAPEHGLISSINFTPFMSGYRDKDKLSLHFITNYFDHYNELKEELEKKFGKEAEKEFKKVFDDYQITISRDQIEYIALFNPKEHERFKKRSQENLP